MQSTLQGNEKQTTSLIGKRLLAFVIFDSVGGVLGFLCFIVPLSVMAIRGDPTGSGSGYFIFGLLLIGPVLAAPGLLISGLVALPIIDPALRATTLSRSDYVRFLVAIAVSALLGIVITWLLAWLLSSNLGLIVPGA